MSWLQSMDAGLFRLIHETMKNPVFDTLMPWFSGNRLFFPLLILISVALILWGKRRAAVCLLATFLAVGVTDGLVCNSLKKAIGRPRPFATLENVEPLVGKGRSNSMPSAHAANWFAGCMVMFLCYRRSALILLPLGLTVSFSRVYNGVHYPSDVLAGAILGAGTGVAVVWLLETAWRTAGRKWFPLWWANTPSLILPTGGSAARNPALQVKDALALREAQWLRAGYLLTGFLLLARLLILASGELELSEDEAYQWVWSKHLALSYFSKPPMIAYGQWLGTAIWGDTELGVRFLSPVFAAVVSILMLKFFAQDVSARAGFVFLLILNTTPILAVGATLFTVDAPSVFFWTLALLAGWRAVQDHARIGSWCWVGLWMGLGFLSKYTALFQWLCWVVFFWMWPRARRHLRKPGPYLALAINLVCALPVLIWNQMHNWVTVQHVVHDNAKLDRPWQPTLKHLGEFVGAEFGLWNPVYFVAVVVAVVWFWKKHRQDARLLYLFSMGMPLFLAYLLFSLRSRVHPNWIAPSVLPLLAFMVIIWDQRWREYPGRIIKWLAAGLVIGLVAIISLYEPKLLAKGTGISLPVGLDPTRRVSGWEQTALVVGEAREQLAREGRPVLIIGNHYGITSQISFYLPEARARVKTDPIVFYQSSEVPKNQYYFWPGYENRSGQNAIYVALGTKTNIPPDRVRVEFESISPPRFVEIAERNRVLRTLQLYECRNLR